MRGDVVLFLSSGAPHDRLIAWGTKGPFVHVEIDLGNEEFIGEHPNGIVRYRGIRPKSTASFTPPASQADIELGLKWAEMQVGKKYGWGDIFSEGLKVLGLAFSFSIPNQWDCSDFVTRYLKVARAAGPLGDAAENPGTVSPNDLARAYQVHM